MSDAYTRHVASWANPRPGFESAIVSGYRALSEFATAHLEAYGSKIGEDYVLGEHWRDMARALLGMLNGESGRLDCGTIDSAIRELAAAHGVELDQ